MSLPLVPPKDPNSNPSTPLPITSPHTPKQFALTRGPLLTKLRGRIHNASRVDIGIGQTSFDQERLYLQADSDGYLIPLNIQEVSTIDGSQHFMIHKSLDSLNQLHRTRPRHLPGHISSPGRDGISTVVDESNRYGYLDKDDGKAYQLLYNHGSKSYYYYNSLGKHVIFPADEVEKMMGQVDPYSNTVHFSQESLNQQQIDNYYNNPNNIARGEQIARNLARNTDFSSNLPLQHPSFLPQPRVSPNNNDIDLVAPLSTPFQPLSEMDFMIPPDIQQRQNAKIADLQRRSRPDQSQFEDHISPSRRTAPNQSQYGDGGYIGGRREMPNQTHFDQDGYKTPPSPRSAPNQDQFRRKAPDQSHLEVMRRTMPSQDTIPQSNPSKPYHPENNLYPDWSYIAEIARQRTRFELQLLFSQTPSPIDHPEILTHQPFILPPRVNSSDGTNASLQALFHLHAINQVAKVAPASSELQQWVGDSGHNNTNNNNKNTQNMNKNSPHSPKTQSEYQTTLKLNTALRGLAQIGSLPPVIKLTFEQQVNLSRKKLLEKEAAIRQSSTTQPNIADQEEEEEFKTHYGPQLSFIYDKSIKVPVYEIPSSQLRLMNNPILYNSPIPQIPQLLTDTVINAQVELQDDLAATAPNIADPKLLVPLILKHLQAQFDIIFQSSPSQLGNNIDSVYQLRHDLLKSLETEPFSLNSPLELPTNTTTIDPDKINAPNSHIPKSNYDLPFDKVNGMSIQDHLSPLLSLKQRINLECSCGLKGPEKTFSSTSIVPLSPSDMMNHRNSIYHFLQIVRARPYNPFDTDNNIVAPSGEKNLLATRNNNYNLQPLSCNHHLGIDRSKYNQFITSRWRGDPKSQHFGIVYPRLSFHPGAGREVYNNTAVNVPFLVPMWNRPKQYKKSTNMSTYFLQSFIVYDHTNEDDVNFNAVPLNNTNDNNNPTNELLPPSQQLSLPNGSSEQSPSSNNHDNNPKHDNKRKFKTYGNISSIGSPSWWYEYRDNIIRKVPIDEVVEATKGLYLGFYTRMSSKDILLRYYYNIHRPRLLKKLQEEEMYQDEIERIERKRRNDRRLKEQAFLSPIGSV